MEPLKHQFGEGLMHRVAADVSAVWRPFPKKDFLRAVLPEIEALELLPRLRLLADALRARLPGDFLMALDILRHVARRTSPGFTALYLPEIVGRHGLHHFEEAMTALREFTPLCSSEFAVRPFLQADLGRALAHMEAWSRDADPHVRRLSSEGCRPRLPWAIRLEALVADPNPVAGILDNLAEDTSPYVRKSVANHLNDITKSHPEWVLAKLHGWNLKHPGTAWIARHALRSLIKNGDQRALATVGAGKQALITVEEFLVRPTHLVLGGKMRLAFRATAHLSQRIVFDYAVHYVKKSGTTTRKVFKWKSLDVTKGSTLQLDKSQVVRDFSTRQHHPGTHRIEVLANGQVVAAGAFQLTIAPPDM